MYVSHDGNLVSKTWNGLPQSPHNWCFLNVQSQAMFHRDGPGISFRQLLDRHHIFPDLQVSFTGFREST